MLEKNTKFFNGSNSSYRGLNTPQKEPQAILLPEGYLTPDGKLTTIEKSEELTQEQINSVETKIEWFLIPFVIAITIYLLPKALVAGIHYGNLLFNTIHLVIH